MRLITRRGPAAAADPAAAPAGATATDETL